MLLCILGTGLEGHSSGTVPAETLGRKRLYPTLLPSDEVLKVQCCLQMFSLYTDEHTKKQERTQEEVTMSLDLAH